MTKTTLTLLVVLTAFLIILQSCYPGDEMTYEDTDIVLTFFDDQANFAEQKTYSLADNVIHIADSSKDEDNINRSYDQQILNLIEDNMEDMGYIEVSDQDTADVRVVALVTTTTWVSGGCYYGYWSYWSYYGWCYPTYYTYTTGSLLIVMAQPSKPGDDKGVWVAGINGVLSSSTSDASNRLNKTINQAFSQSPYLGDGK